jgi:hypothetical protein
MSTLIKTTQDGRPVEVIGQTVYLGGKKEAEGLVLVRDHPNRAAIVQALPEATHMAGRIPLTAEEAVKALGAIEEGRLAYENSPKGIAERIRRAQNNAISNRDG